MLTPCLFDEIFNNISKPSFFDQRATFKGQRADSLKYKQFDLFSEGKLKNNLESKKTSKAGNQTDWFLLGLSVSFFLHVLGFIYLELTSSNPIAKSSLNNTQAIKINFVEKTDKALVEVKQEETKEKVETNRKGLTNHKTDKETKIARDKLSHKKGQKAGGNKQKNSLTAEKNRLLESLEDLKRMTDKTSQLVANPKAKTGVKVKREKNPYLEKARNQYEKFLAANYAKLESETETGYQDYIDEDIEQGDRIDLNTKEYRYIGYFSGLRRSIELVWHYPREAVMRGMEGTVGLEFSINKKGDTTKVKVVKSSGFKALDTAIVNAVKLASPFAPLPEGIGKEKLTITGSFSYVLNNWGVAH